MRGGIFWSWAALAALSVGLARGDDTAPKAVLTGPSTVSVGAMAVIKTDGSVGKNFRWLILPKEAEGWFLAVYVDVGPGQQQRAGILVPAATGTIYVNYIASQGDQADVTTLVINPSGGTVTPVETNPYTADEAFQAKVAPLAGFKLARADATALGAMYARLAADTTASGTKIKTCSDLRTALIARYKALGFGGKYAGFGTAADEVFAATLGDDPKGELEPGGIGPLLVSMAWAAWEAGK